MESLFEDKGQHIFLLGGKSFLCLLESFTGGDSNDFK